MRSWEAAWREALYGPTGFYRRPEGPAAHFRTACHAAPDLLGQVLADLAGQAGCARVVDVGAGGGELLLGIHRARPDLDLLGVDVGARPAALPAAAGWSDHPPAVMPATLLVGWELLDVVPCPVLEVGPDGQLAVVEIDERGRERLGGPAREPDLDWCRRWWPAARPGQRVEVGRTRDALWGGLVARLRDGLAVAVDYGHLAGTRPTGGSLTGYRAGRQVPPVPDGRCDLTAHVALDALAASAPGGRLSTQHEALRALGVSAARPSPPTGSDGVSAYLAALERVSAAQELLDPDGLGGFGWVVHHRP